MVPAGDPTRDTVKELGELLGEGDLVVDGGNSKWTDDQINAELLAAKGIGFVDCGVSGGVWGLQNGYALMCGGSDDDVAKVQPAFDALKPEGDSGFVHAGKQPGAGHFAKMVHNGIEYAIMQAYAEGWELLEKVDLVDNVTEVFDSWREGTVIRSWLLDLLVDGPQGRHPPRQDPGYADDSGEGRWTVEAAHRPRRRDARDRRLARSPASSPAGRQPGDEGDRGDAQPVRRSRGADRGASRRRRLPTTEDRRAPVRPSRSAVYVAHLTLHDFRSYADRGGRARARAPRRSSAATARARPTWSRRSTTSRGSAPTGSPPTHPLVRAGAEQALVRAAVVRDGRQAILEVEINPGKANRARVNRRRPAPGSRAGRAGPHRDVRPRRPGPGQGRPAGPPRASSTTCWCCVRRAWPAYAPTTTGSSSSATPCSRPPALRAAGRPPQDSALSTLGVWDYHLARTGAELLAERLRLVDELRPYVGKAYATVARGATQRRRRSRLPAQSSRSRG